MELAQISQLIGSISGVITGSNNALDIIGVITGNSSKGSAAMLKELTNINNTLQIGFSNLNNAISLETLNTNWTPISNSLNTIHQRCLDNIELLSGITVTNSIYPISNFPSGLVIFPNGQATDFEEWCNVELPLYQSFFNYSPYFLPESNLEHPSLLSILSDQSEVSNDTGSAISIWNKIIEDAQANSNTAFSQYFNQTRFDLTFQFMQEIYMILGMVYYVHDTSLALIRLNNPNSSLAFNRPILGKIMQHFGPTKTDYNRLNNILPNRWSTFIDYMAAIPSSSPTSDHLNASLGSQDFQGVASSVNAQQIHANVGYQNDYQYIGINFYLDEVCAPAGSYITSIGFLDRPNDSFIDVTLQITCSSPENPNENEPVLGKFSGTPVNLNKENVVFYFGTEYCNLSPVLEPNNIQVLTGVQLSQTADSEGFVINMRTGIYETSDILNPVVSINNPKFQSVSGQNNRSNIQLGTNLNPAGSFVLNNPKNNTSIANRGAIVTNASLINTPNQSNGISSQMAAKFYAADFMQPRYWPTIITAERASGIFRLQNVGKGQFLSLLENPETPVLLGFQVPKINVEIQPGSEAGFYYLNFGPTYLSYSNQELTIVNTCDSTCNFSLTLLADGSYLISPMSNPSLNVFYNPNNDNLTLTSGNSMYSRFAISDVTPLPGSGTCTIQIPGVRQFLSSNGDQLVLSSAASEIQISLIEDSGSYLYYLTINGLYITNKPDGFTLENSSSQGAKFSAISNLDGTFTFRCPLLKSDWGMTFQETNGTFSLGLEIGAASTFSGFTVNI